MMWAGFFMIATVSSFAVCAHRSRCSRSSDRASRTNRFLNSALLAVKATTWQTTWWVWMNSTTGPAAEMLSGLSFPPHNTRHSRSDVLNPPAPLIFSA